MASHEAPVVALLVGRPLESQRFVQVRAKPRAPRLDHHLGRDELVVRGELDVMLDPVEREHQVQFVDIVRGRLLSPILDRSLPTFAHLVPVVEIRQLVRVERPVLVHPSRDQEFRFRDVSRVSGRRAKAGKAEGKSIKGDVRYFYLFDEDKRIGGKKNLKTVFFFFAFRFSSRTFNVFSFESTIPNEFSFSEFLNS